MNGRRALIKRNNRKEIFDHFAEYLPKFKKVVPHDFKKMQQSIAWMEEKGLSSEAAQMEAFRAVTGQSDVKIGVRN